MKDGAKREEVEIADLSSGYGTQGMRPLRAFTGCFVPLDNQRQRIRMAAAAAAG